MWARVKRIQILEMSSLYLGVRLPEKPYERLKLDDVNFSTTNVVDLKNDAEKLLNFSHDELGAYFKWITNNKENYDANVWHEFDFL